ncbi:hypothetical protein D9613_010762 [Agrocybe pediades]|uniref:Xylanolytic transcriptional activator regulatory domain-containing protein n=1 Tax=Agrocybe pediades TaxID=84607 RepID=A0A8H4QKV8_9AGAR|nr:hypothetical protein D9613_010762 [Agrocybe pediades]
MASSSRTNEDRSAQGYLPRGGACKCDGNRPICGQCDRAGRAEDCEYTTGSERSTVQILEENISRLEARIQELQNPGATDTQPAAVRLHQPYTDPPRHIAEALINGFMPHATQLGLFLNLTRFRTSFLLNQPIGHASRPSPALISSTYLWAIRLSNDPTIKSHEQAYLTRATQDASTALSGNHPRKVMHAIQAEVLLATYFFASGRFFEGKYHVTTAVSMVFSAGLHKIRSATPPPQAPSIVADTARLPPPIDSTEEGERITAFWTVLDLDKQWAVALEHTPNFEYSSHPMATKVDTPWPLEMEEFEQGRLPQHARTSNTIYNFLNNVPTPDLGISLRAIEAKAAILWERVALFNRKCSASTSQNSMQPLIQEFSNLSGLLDSLVSLLPSRDPQTLGRMQFADKARRIGITFSMLCAAGIRLHAPFAHGGRSESSKRKRLLMARTMLEIAIAIRARGSAFLNPLIGTMWIEATQVLFDEIALIRNLRASGNLPPHNADDMAMLDLIQRATAAMTEFGTNMPLISFQVGKIQESALSF